MTFDSTITLGNVVTLVGFLFGLWAAANRTYHSLDKRATIFEAMIHEHSRLLAEHSKRMEQHDRTLTDILQKIANIVGRMESAKDGPDEIAHAAAAAIRVIEAEKENAIKTLAAARSAGWRAHDRNDSDPPVPR